MAGWYRKSLLHHLLRTLMSPYQFFPINFCKQRPKCILPQLRMCKTIFFQDSKNKNVKLLTHLLFTVLPVLATSPAMSALMGNLASKGVSRSHDPSRLRSPRSRSKTRLKTPGWSESDKRIWQRSQSIRDRKLVKMVNKVGSKRLGSRKMVLNCKNI